MTDCMLASERGNELREAVLAECRAPGPRRLGPARPGASCATSSSARAGAPASSRSAWSPSPGELDVDALIDAVRCEGLFWTQTAGLGETTQGGETQLLSGTPQLRERLGDLEFLISPEAFFQTNTEMAELLYGVAVEMAALRGHERVYDLYCGIGTIGLTLASRARARSSASRSSSAPVADAIENAQAQRDRDRPLLRRRHPPGDARRSSSRPGGPTSRSIDPPRAGLSQKVVRRIVEAAPEADRLRLLQPDHAGAERGPAGRGRLRAQARAPRRPVPADAAHRVRRAAGGRSGRRREPRPRPACGR